MNDPTHSTDVLTKSTGSSQGSRAIFTAHKMAQIVNSPQLDMRMRSRSGAPCAALSVAGDRVARVEVFLSGVKLVGKRVGPTVPRPDNE
jgi:hypothetical protein